MASPSVRLFQNEEQPPTPAPSPAPFTNTRIASISLSPLSHSSSADLVPSDPLPQPTPRPSRIIRHPSLADALSMYPMFNQSETAGTLSPGRIDSTTPRPPLVHPSSAMDTYTSIKDKFDSLTEDSKADLIKLLLLRSSKPVFNAIYHAIDPYMRQDPFKLFPNEISLKILSYLEEPKTLARCSQVSRLWYLMVSDDYTWKELCQKHHFRRLSAAVSIDRQTRLPSISVDPHQIGMADDILEAVYNPAVTKRPSPRSYRSHFKQQYLLNSAWATGGQTAARYTIDHQGVVTALVVSEKYIVIALDNSKIFVFREDGKLLRSLFGHVMGVWALALKGNRLISGGCDRDVRVWDILSGDCLQIMRGHTSTVRCLQMADDTIAVSGSRDTTVRVWDTEQGICKYTLEGHELSVRCIEVSGNYAVSGSYDCTAKIWDISNGTLVHTLSGHFSQIYSLAFDGQRVATGSLDSSIRIWDAQTGVCIGMLQGHTSLIAQLQMKGDTLVSGGSDGAIRVWDLKDYKCVARIAAHDNSVTCLQFDNERIVSGGSDGKVRVWRLSDGQYLRDLSSQFEVVWRVAIKDDEIIILASRGGKAIMEVTSFIPPVDDNTTSRRVPEITFNDDSTRQSQSSLSSGVHSPKGSASDSRSGTEAQLDTGISPLSEERIEEEQMEVDT